MADAHHIDDRKLSAKYRSEPLHRVANPGFFVKIPRKAATIGCMQIAIFGMRLLEVMFFVGLAGSTIVVLISFVEDAKELFGDE
jgi:hypothetical protein